MESQEYRNGKVRLCGTDFDYPSNLLPREITRWTEGKRTKLVGINLCEYRKEGNATVCWQYTLSMSNYGGCFLDGKPLKGDDIERAKTIFKELSIAP